MAANGLFRMFAGSLMMPLRLLAWSLFLGAIPVSAQDPAPSSFSEQERNPNWIPPLSQFGQWGWAEGRLLEPRALSVGPDDRILVADSGNHRIQVFLSDGRRVGGWGKPGSAEGEFLFPSGIAAGPKGEVFVADTGNDRVQVFDGTGKFVRLLSRKGKDAGPIRRPWRVAAGADRIALIEQDDPRVEILSADGDVLAAIGGFGEGPGQFKDPSGLAFDADGNLYVADTGNSRIQKFDSSGKPVLEWGSWGSPAGLFSSPRGVACGTGRVYVADADNHRVQVFDPKGRFLYQWGKAPVEPLRGEGRLHFPTALAVSPSGGLTVVAEPVDHRCQVFANGIAKKVLPSSELPWWETLHARGHAVMSTGKAPVAPSVWGKNPPFPVAVLESDAHAVIIYDLGAIPPAILARAGGFGRKLGEFAEPCALVQDHARGRLYVADRGNRRVQAMQLERQDASPTGFAPGVKVIAAFEPAARVPAAVAGYLPRIGVPEALALDSDGNLLVLDGPNGAVLVFNPRFDFVRAVRIAAPAPFHPVGIAVRPDGKAYYLVNPLGFQVVAVDLQGRVLTSWGARGAEGKSSFLFPSGIAVEGGAVFVTDALQLMVKKFDDSGASLGQWGGYGNVLGRFLRPQGLAAVPPGRILVDDLGNHRAHLYHGDGRGLDVLTKGSAVLPAPK